MENKTEEIVINVEGMMCGGCEKRIENAVSNLKGVAKVVANHEDGTVIIQAEQGINIKEVKDKIEDIGFSVNS